MPGTSTDASATDGPATVKGEPPLIYGLTLEGKADAQS